jgi:hypothetical protein
MRLLILAAKAVPCLPALPHLATWPALARLRTHQDRFSDAGPRSSDRFGRVEHPGLQILIVLHPVPP